MAGHIDQSQPCAIRLETNNVADWRDKAACSDLAVSVNFLPYPPTPDAIALATDVCATCPVRTECKAFADSFSNAVGVWGGELYTLEPEGTDEPHIID